MKKYGCVCSFQADEVKEKIKETNIQRYGFEYAQQCDNVKEKIKQTNLEKYGCVSYTSTSEYKNYRHNKYVSMTHEEKQKIIQKQQETCYMLYGVTNPFQAEEIKNKIKQIKIERYGDEWYNNKEKASKTKQNFSEETKHNIIIKQKKTKLIRYGDENYRNEEKIKQTNKEKYGCEYDVIIYTWVDLDVRKRNIAKENNVKRLEFWSIDEVKKWLNEN